MKSDLYKSGKSPYRLSKQIGVSSQSVTNFFAGRLKKAGKANCRKIRAELRKLGIIKPRKQCTCIDYECPDRLTRKQSNQSSSLNQSSSHANF